MYSFIIAFPLARLDNLLQTIRLLYRNDPDIIAKSELVLLCQDRCGRIDTKFTKFQLHNMNLPNMQKSKMINYGVKQSTYEKLIILDSDRVFSNNFFARELSNHKEKTVKSNLILRHLLEPHHDNDILNNNFKYKEDHKSENNELFKRNMFAGSTIINKSDYLMAGGMDEDYIGYGFEDHDMTSRLKKVKIEFIWLNSIELHLWHERLTYGSGDQKKLFIDNGLRYCKKWNEPIPLKLSLEINEYSKRML